MHQNDGTWQGPLFVVGASRSGTTMLRSILNRAPDIQLAGETHYFDDLRPRLKGRPLAALTEGERARAADYFRAQSVRPYGVRANPDDSPLSRADLLAAAEGGDDVFEAYCRWHMDRAGARIWGEKTPRHIFRIDDILAAYPQARILCTLRDPRAVVASYRDWRYQGGLKKAEGCADYQAAIAEDHRRKKASYHVVIAALMWRAAARAALAARARYSEDRVRVVRYEDVVARPAETVRPLTDWLGVAYDDTLLDIPLHNSSATRFDAASGPSAAPNRRWAKVLAPWEVAVIQQVGGATLTAAGYERAPVSASLPELARAYGSLPTTVVRAARANRARYGSLSAYMARRLQAALR